MFASLAAAHDNILARAITFLTGFPMASAHDRDDAGLVAVPPRRRALGSRPGLLPALAVPVHGAQVPRRVGARENSAAARRPSPMQHGTGRSREDSPEPPHSKHACNRRGGLVETFSRKQQSDPHFTGRFWAPVYLPASLVPVFLLGPAPYRRCVQRCYPVLTLPFSETAMEDALTPDNRGLSPPLRLLSVLCHSFKYGASPAASSSTLPGAARTPYAHSLHLSEPGPQCVHYR